MSKKVEYSRSQVRHQHYVPRCLLSAFAKPGNGKKAQLQIFDKSTERSFVSATENVFAQRDFNTFQGDGVTICLEDGMAKIEDQAAPVLKAILDKRSLATLNDHERAALLSFVSLQKIRGVSTRAQMTEMVVQLKRRIAADGSDPDTIPQLRDASIDQTKLAALELIRENLADFTHHFADKVMMLHEAPDGTEFLIGDTPVVWTNERDTGPYGSLGLAVLGIEIQMPLSPRYCLVFWCPTIVKTMEEDMLRAAKVIQKLKSQACLGTATVSREAARLLGKAEPPVSRVENDLKNIKAGKPILLTKENMLRANSLQVAQSERYLASRTGDFSFIKQMLRDNSNYRIGPRHELTGPGT